MPGVRHAAFAWGVPLTGNSWPAELEVAGRAAARRRIVDRISLPVRSVTEDYFAVMGMRLAEGRLFLPTDNGDAPRVGIVNRRSSASTSATAPALGQQLRFPGNDKPTTIVGVIADTRTERLRERAGAGAVPAVLAERRVLEAPRRAGDRRSAGVAPQVRAALRAHRSRRSPSNT